MCTDYVTKKMAHGGCAQYRTQCRAISGTVWAERQEAKKAMYDDMRARLNVFLAEHAPKPEHW
jgi:hypothetical protein